MQSWISRGSRCLFCALRPVFRPMQRSFSTSPILEKTRKSQKAKQEKAEAVEKSSKKNVTDPNIHLHSYSFIVDKVADSFVCHTVLEKEGTGP